MNKVACLTGFTGQDGTWLSQLLLSKGYTVVGIVRRAANRDLSFMSEFGIENVIVEEADLTDSASLYDIINKYPIDEFYNLGAQSHVGTSFNQPLLTVDVTGMGPLRILDLLYKHSPNTKYYNAASSEMHGDVQEIASQNEDTALRARSPYAAAKILSHQLTKVYRESYGLFACSGILENHESPRRSEQFVTRKITSYLARRRNGLTKDPLRLGNLYAIRDFGSAKDYVEAMYLMMQHHFPDDYVIGTGHSHSVKEFLDEAIRISGYEGNWSGSGLDEVFVLKGGEPLVVIDENFYRPCEVPYLCGDYSKAKKVLGWSPRTSFSELVEWMVDYDYSQIQKRCYGQAT